MIVDIAGSTLASAKTIFCFSFEIGLLILRVMLHFYSFTLGFYD